MSKCPADLAGWSPQRRSMVALSGTGNLGSGWAQASGLRLVGSGLWAQGSRLRVVGSG